jgi:anti-sigma factor RsiW
MADEVRTCGDLDERLAAYVDGEDTPAAHHAVDAHLTACPECRDAARNESAARELVQWHRQSLVAHASDTLRARCRQLPASGSQLPASGFQPASGSRLRASLLRKWAPLSLAATLVLAVAGVFVFGLNDRVQALAASLAVDHVKCFKVTGTAVEADAHTSEVAWQQGQGWPIVVPQAEASQQLRLVDVRRCFTSDGRSAHMMYTWRGEPLSVYVLQEDAGRDEIVHKMGQRAVIWCTNRRTYAVVTSDTTQDLTPIVGYIKAHVQ